MKPTCNVKDFQDLLRLIESFPEVAITESNFNEKNILSCYITTKGKWPKKLSDAFREQFPLPEGIPFILLKRIDHEILSFM